MLKLFSKLKELSIPLITFVLVISTHYVLITTLKFIKEEKVIVVEPTKTIKINLNKVILKKEEVKLTPPKVEEPIVKKKEIIKKPLPKTKSKNIIKKKKPKKKKKHRKKKVVKKSIPKPVEPIIPTPAIAPKKAKKVVPQISPKKLKTIENAYLAQLSRLIESKKVYPKSAKRMRQTGKVYLSFNILKDGTITGVRVSIGSKYKRLNKAAVEILKKIGKYKPIPSELKKSSWNNITVTVKYNITD